MFFLYVAIKHTICKETIYILILRTSYILVLVCLQCDKNNRDWEYFFLNYLNRFQLYN